MIRIAITAAAYEAIVTTVPFGSVGYEAKPSAGDQIFIWLERRALPSTAVTCTRSRAVS
jgi:hypothetical protein